ncbi:MAG: homoserine kinase [Alphaproteobacteria bacterium]|nr:homoserine kinase [Alphaproteobacteria bacterium]
MAVYTPISEDVLARAIARYDLGALERFEGIAEGVENSNFHVFTSRGRYVLTLFEKRVRADDIPFFLALMEHLAARGAPAPAPIADRRGVVLQEIAGRPAVFAAFLPGAARMQPGPADCRALGETMARLHAAGADFPRLRPNDLGPEGWRALADKCRNRADECAPGLAGLIDDEISFLRAAWPENLPSGVIHADLFPDNVFFCAEGRISGVIDFYFACTDALAYDLAVSLNSWCWQGREWRSANRDAMIAGYESVRSLTHAERTALPLLLRGAALRFLLTRLHDFLHQVEGAVVTVKDPLEYRDLLLFHRGPQLA